MQLADPSPAHEGKDVTCLKRHDPMAEIKHVLLRNGAKPNPIFDSVLDPNELDMSKIDQ